VFRAHWHTANERIVRLEGRLAVRHGDTESMSCVSKTRCTFYVYWDSKLDFHAASAGQ
jgi:hypothetical protein